jgi:hypothetical protein
MVAPRALSDAVQHCPAFEHPVPRGRQHRGGAPSCPAQISAGLQHGVVGRPVLLAIWDTSRYQILTESPTLRVTSCCEKRPSTSIFEVTGQVEPDVEHCSHSALRSGLESGSGVRRSASEHRYELVPLGGARHREAFSVTSVGGADAEKSATGAPLLSTAQRDDSVPASTAIRPRTGRTPRGLALRCRSWRRPDPTRHHTPLCRAAAPRIAPEERASTHPAARALAETPHTRSSRSPPLRSRAARTRDCPGIDAVPSRAARLGRRTAASSAYTRPCPGCPRGAYTCSSPGKSALRPYSCTR